MMLKYKDYIGKVEIDPDENILYGTVIGLRDMVTFEGRTPAEVQVAFRESVDDYLAFCALRGEAPDKPMSGKFIVRVSPTLHQRVTRAAEAQGVSLNSLVKELLRREYTEYFDQVNRAYSSSAASKKPPRVRNRRVARRNGTKPRAASA